MTAIVEGRQRLDFDASWNVVKWDDADEFKGSMERALHQLSGNSVKAADVVAVRQRQGSSPTMLVAELKDFAHPEIPADRRAQHALQATSDRLMAAVVRKVIDTLCGASHSYGASDERSEELEAWRTALGASEYRLLILVCVEVPRTQLAAVLTWTKALQQRLRWLGPHASVLVTTSRTPFRAEGIEYSV